MKRQGIILFLIFSIGQSYGETIPGEQMLEFFSANCKTHGEWTKQALRDAEALMVNINSIANDPDCQSVAGAIGQLSNLTYKINSLEDINSHRIDADIIEAQEREILLQLSRTNDPMVRQQLQSALSDLQIQRAGLIGTIRAYDNQLALSKSHLMSEIVTVSNSAIEQIVNNQVCLLKRPQLLGNIGSLTAAITSASSSINPALSLGLAAGTDIIGSIVDGVRKGRLASKIRKLSNSSTAIEAYKCVMESLSNRWCEMDDAIHFLNYKAVNRRERSRDELKKAVRLVDIEIPVFLNWLTQIRSGVQATTSADAERQRNVFNREAKVRSAKAKGSGIIGENRPLYQKTVTPLEKWSVIRSVINKLLSDGNNSRFANTSVGGNPLFDIYTQSYAPFYLLGLSTQPRSSGGFGIGFNEFDPFSQWPNGAFVPNYEILQSRYFQWVDLAKQRVNQELALALQPDPLKLITSAWEPSSNRWKKSPKESVETLVKFLTNNVPRNFERGVYDKLYTSTISKLTRINDLINEATFGDTGVSPREALQKIFNEAELEFGVAVLQSRLDMIVRLSLLQLFKRATPEDQNMAAQLLVADRFADVLSKISGTDNYALIMADLKRARPITLATMESFVEVFRKNIKTLLKELLKKEKNASGMIKEIHRRSRTELCFGLLSAPKWPSKIDKKYCLGLKLGPIIPGGPSSKRINSKLMHSSFLKRACSYRDYLRSSKIYQDWGIR